MITYHDETLPEGMLLKAEDGWFELRYEGALLATGSLTSLEKGHNLVIYKGKNPQYKEVVNKILADFNYYLLDKQQKEKDRQKSLEEQFLGAKLEDMENYTDSNMELFLNRKGVL